MRPVIAVLLACVGLAAGDARYELSGRVVPECQASVSLHGATSPFSASTQSDERGRFRFRGLLAGTYTLAVFVPARGETRRTIEVGPAVTSGRGRVEIRIEVSEARLETDDQ